MGDGADRAFVLAAIISAVIAARILLVTFIWISFLTKVVGGGQLALGTCRVWVLQNYGTAFQQRLQVGDDLLSPSNAGYLAIPYADLRRPPITLAELHRARTMLSAKGTSRSIEDLIFKTKEAQRRIERGSAHRSRRARRSLAKHPIKTPAGTLKTSEPEVNYDQAVTPYAGEEW